MVAYGKSNRDNPIGIGTVKKIVDVREGVSDIHILGDGNSKIGEIRNYKISGSRIIILPDSY